MSKLFLDYEGLAIYDRWIKSYISGVYVPRLPNDTNSYSPSRVALSAIYAPSTSGGSSYTFGEDGYVLKSNGSSVYWGVDNNTTYSPGTNMELMSGNIFRVVDNPTFTNVTCNSLNANEKITLSSKVHLIYDSNLDALKFCF